MEKKYVLFQDEAVWDVLSSGEDIVAWTFQNCIMSTRRWRAHGVSVGLKWRIAAIF
jgi:hypothetical protein